MAFCERKAHALLVAVKGAFCQIIESGFTRFLSRYTSELLLHADIIQQALHPSGSGALRSVLAFRFLRRGNAVVCGVVFAGGKTVFQVMQPGRREQIVSSCWGDHSFIYICCPADRCALGSSIFPCWCCWGLQYCCRAEMLRSSRSMIV